MYLYKNFTFKLLHRYTVKTLPSKYLNDHVRILTSRFIEAKKNSSFFAKHTDLNQNCSHENSKLGKFCLLQIVLSKKITQLAIQQNLAIVDYFVKPFFPQFCWFIQDKLLLLSFMLCPLFERFLFFCSQLIWSFIAPMNCSYKNF